MARKQLGVAPSTAKEAVTYTEVPFKFVQITQAAYDALGSKDSTTVYMIVG